MQRTRYVVEPNHQEFEEGFIIECRIHIDGWRCLDTFTIDVGPIPKERKDLLYGLLGELVHCLANDDTDGSHKVFKLLNPIVGWPHDMNKNAACLEDFDVIYRDKDGKIYKTQAVISGEQNESA